MDVQSALTGLKEARLVSEWLMSLGRLEEFKYMARRMSSDRPKFFRQPLE
jgi:hypothetical protein